MGWHRWVQTRGSSQATAHAAFVVVAVVLVGTAIGVALGPAHAWLHTIIAQPTALTPPRVP